MKIYDKEKIREYAKELFILCLDKDLIFKFDNYSQGVTVDLNGLVIASHYDEEWFNLKDADNVMPIWELLEKVKKLNK